MPMRSAVQSDFEPVVGLRHARRSATVGVLGVFLMAGCEVRGVIGSDLTSMGSTSAQTSTTSDTTLEGSSDDTMRFDVAHDVHVECNPPPSGPCDDIDDDPWRAMGLGCPGEVEIETSFAGAPEAITVHEGVLGSSGVYAPREGTRFVILSTGHADHLPMTPAQLQATLPECEPIVCPSSDLGEEERKILPAPIDVRRVAEDRDCAEDSTLVGSGDCSNSLWTQWVAGSGAHDYVELRMRAVVPPQTDGIRYDFAFFSVEYPLWVDHASPWNDMYVAWLESESWTGNISFDEGGSPISVNSVFLDYKDAPSDACPEPCSAPELGGFAMEGHAGTKWLTTTAPVRAGEQIELVFALFDLSDPLFDTMVILDNFQWTCSGLPPFTNPAA
jgi:hypothetical protein